MLRAGGRDEDGEGDIGGSRREPAGPNGPTTDDGRPTGAGGGRGGGERVPAEDRGAS